MGVDVLPYDASAARRHDRHLRQPLGEHRAVALRCPAGARQPPRHPSDGRRHRRVHRRAHDPPRRLRPGRDQQPGHRGRRADRRSSAPALAGLASAAEGTPPAIARPGRRRSPSSRARWPDTGELPGIEGINPNLLMHQLAASRRRSAYVADVGQHQMWAAQSLRADRRAALPHLRRHGCDGLGPAAGDRRGVRARRARSC